MSARSWGVCPPWQDALQEWIERTGGIVFAMGSTTVTVGATFDTHLASEFVIATGHSCRLVPQLDIFDSFPHEKTSNLWFYPLGYISTSILPTSCDTPFIALASHT